MNKPRMVNEVTGEIIDGEPPSEQTALVAAKQYLDLQREARAVEKPMKAAQDLVREYVARFGDLTDGESVRAYFIEARMPDTFDLRRLAQDWPGVVVWMAEQGLLSVDTKAFDTVAPCSEIDQAKKVRMAGPRQQKLQIKAVKA